MKITEREFAKVARVKAIEAIGELCDTGTGLSCTFEELIICKCFNTLSRIRKSLFKDKEDGVGITRKDLIEAAAKASADGDNEHHFMEGLGPIGFMAVTMMEAKTIGAIWDELSKEEE